MHRNDATDPELIARGKAGDNDALSTLYRRYRTRVFGFLMRLTADRDLAEDVLCETFARFLKNLHRYQPEGSLAAYLMKIARTRLIDELRARGRLSQPLPDEDCGPLPLAKDPGPPETASTAEMVDLAQRALAQLPVSLREVVLLRLHEDLDYAAIGTIVGVGETTARSRMRYALEALRDRLKAEP